MGNFTGCVLSQEAARYLPVRRWKRRPSRAVAGLAYAHLPRVLGTVVQSTILSTRRQPDYATLLPRYFPRLTL